MTLIQYSEGKFWLLENVPHAPTHMGRDPRAGFGTDWYFVGAMNKYEAEMKSSIAARKEIINQELLPIRWNETFEFWSGPLGKILNGDTFPLPDSIEFKVLDIHDIFEPVIRLKLKEVKPAHIGHGNTVDHEGREENIRLRGELERLKAENELFKADHDTFYTKALNMQEEIEKLKSELNRVQTNCDTWNALAVEVAKQNDVIESERDQFAIGFHEWVDEYGNAQAYISLSIEEKIEVYKSTIPK